MCKLSKMTHLSHIRPRFEDETAERKMVAAFAHNIFKTASLRIFNREWIDDV